MSGQLQNGEQQFFDNNGKPLNGGTIDFYVPNTTTRKTTWQDQGLTIQNTNPIILDAGGKAIIWGSGSYRQVLKDNHGNLIWDQVVADPIISLSGSTGASQVGANDGTGGSIFTTVAGFISSIASSIGSSLVGFIQSGVGAVRRTIQDDLREQVKVTQFGALGNGIADDTAAVLAAWNYTISSPQKRKLVFPAGIYKCSSFPNFAVQDAVIEAFGEVRLRYTGTGNAVIFDAGASALIFNVRFLGNFIIEAPGTSMNGIYLRSVHHSVIEARIAGCGTSSSGLQVEFAVATEFRIRVSGNEGAWYAGAQPAKGIYLTRRNSGENASACIFYNQIIEGVSGDGITCDYAIQNRFIGGTSEGNGGIGVVCTPNSDNNTFAGIDLELNTGGGIKDGGNDNTFTEILNDGSTTIDSTARVTTLRDGFYDSIVNNGIGTILDGIRYSVNGGAISGSGTLSKRNVYSATSASFELDQPMNSIVMPAVSVPNNTPTTAITLPSSGNNFFQVFSYLPNIGAASVYGACAVIYQDLGSAKIMSQTDGTRMMITLSGQNIQVTQTSGATQNVYVSALPI